MLRTELVASCNHHQTLYGRDLVVTAIAEGGGMAFDRWHEEEYDPETNRARYDVMLAVWKAGRARS